MNRLNFHRLTLTLRGGSTAFLENLPIDTKSPDAQLVAALTSGDESIRLKAALAIGSNPQPELLDLLVAQCAIEADFYVRDMLTWALTRFPPQSTVPKLLAELHSQRGQARSQALHTLSKIRDPDTWSAITRSLLYDANDEVARSAWRAAVALVPVGQKKSLALDLAAQLGRGDRDLQLSLSRALAALGEDAVGPVLRTAAASQNPDVRAHAAAAERLLREPDSASEAAINAAKRSFVLRKER